MNPLYERSRDGDVNKIFRWIPQLYRDTTKRMGFLERQIDKLYPDLFDRIEQYRRSPANIWPQWCYLPTGAVVNILCDFYNAPASEAIHRAPAIAGMAAWRASGRNAIQPHQDMFTNLIKRDNDRIPPGLQHGLAIPAVYFAFETPTPGGVAGAMGVLAVLSWTRDRHDNTTEATQLWLLLDTQPVPGVDAFQANPLQLSEPSVSHALERVIASGLVATMTLDNPPPDHHTDAIDSALISHLGSKLGDYVAVLDLLQQPTTRIIDAAQVLGRRDGFDWPAAAGEGDDLALWLMMNPEFM